MKCDKFKFLIFLKNLSINRTIFTINLRIKKMNFIFILICSWLFIQKSRESLPENVEFLELSEIFKDKINNIGYKLNNIYQKFNIESKLLNNQGFMNKTSSKASSLNKSNQSKNNYNINRNEICFPSINQMLNVSLHKSSIIFSPLYYFFM